MIIDLNFVFYKIAKRECLFCDTNLDKQFGAHKWHIPLCINHRQEELDRMFKDKEVIRCPYCLFSKTVVKSGFHGTKQRYKCNYCNKRFIVKE